nr:PREDICTED: uncharacterized protein LOC109031262 isoform X2 [Bemisia tabaci]
MIGAQFYDAGPHFSDLVKLRDKALFVDKSLLIEHILTSHEHIVIEAPGGFGKTTNLRMLKEFFELEVDIDGKAVEDVNSTTNFATFATPPLEIIAKYPQIFRDYFAQSPVIYVNMGSVSITHFDESFRRMVTELFLRHDYLERSPRLSGTLKDDFELYRDKCPELSLSEVVLGGEKLSVLLRGHHQKNIIVLIDNYDAPLREALLAQASALDMKNFDHVYENVVLFIARLVQGNSNVARSVLTGRMRVIASHKGEPDNLVHLSIFDHEQLWRYYGLTKKDINTLGDQLFRETKWELNYTDVNAWYGGYKTILPEQKLHNTFSTTMYLKTHQLKRHRIHAEELRSNLSNLLPYERLGKTLEEAFDEQTRISRVKLIQRDLKELRAMISDPNHKLNRDLALQYLVEIGLFSLDGDRLTVPNLEADADLKALLLTCDYFKSKFRIQDLQVNDYIETLDRLGNRGQTYEDLAGAVLQLFEFQLPASSRELLHALVYLAADTKFPQVFSEEAIDRKRRDFFVQRYDSTGILVGVECGNGTAYDALKQLVDCKRYEIFRQRKLSTGILVGLAINERPECTLAYLHDNGTYSYNLAGHRNAVWARLKTTTANIKTSKT